MKTIFPIDKRRLLGYIAGITAGVSYGMNPLFGKALMESGVPVMVMLFFRYGFAAVFTAILMLIRKQSFKAGKREIGLLILLGLLFAGSSITLFTSYAYSATDIIIDSQTTVDKKVIWERKLLDLSLRNNLLNTRITQDTIPVISVNVAELEDALADNQDFQVCPKPTDWENDALSAGVYKAINAGDPVFDLVREELSQHRIRTYLSEERLKNALKHLYRASRTIMEENGANTLYDRYIELYEHITGAPFQRHDDEDILGRIAHNVEAFLAGEK